MSEQRLSEIRAWLNGETPQLPGGIADVRWLLDQLLATRDVLEAAVNNERGWWTKAARILAVREAVSAGDDGSGLVVPEGDVRCDTPKDACRCMKRKGHDGSHACAHGSWLNADSPAARTQERTAPASAPDIPYSQTEKMLGYGTENDPRRAARTPEDDTGCALAGCPGRSDGKCPNDYGMTCEALFPEPSNLADDPAREAVSADTPEECPIHGCSIRVTGRCGVCIAEGRYDEGGSVSAVGGEGT